MTSCIGVSTKDYLKNLVKGVRISDSFAKTSLIFDWCRIEVTIKLGKGIESETNSV